MTATYTTIINALCDLLVATTTDVNFTTILPSTFDYADNRLYRDLDLLNTVTRTTGTLTTGARTLALPSTNGTFIVVEQLNVITPAGTTDAESGTRVPLTPISRETLDYLWPSVTGSATPVYFARVTDGTAIVGPWPNAAYSVEVVGTIRPQVLSSTNVTTLLTWYFPDLYVSACMVYLTGYQRDFGAQTDDPQRAVSWESQYQTLLRSATVEEQRKRFAGAGWSPKSPEPIATPPRV